MQRIDTISSDISSIGYKPKEYTLEVKFYDLCVHKYYDVPNNIFQAFLGADSQGRYFDSFIKGKYDYDRIKKSHFE